MAVACDMPPRRGIKKRREDKENNLYILKLYILTTIPFLEDFDREGVGGIGSFKSGIGR